MLIENKWFFVSFNFLRIAKQISIKYFEESEFSRKPEQTTGESAGYYLYAADTITILLTTAQTISLDLRFAIPAGYFGQISPRSSILVNHLVTVDGGVIDSDFRGIVKAILVNLSDKTFTVRVGDRIAQLIILEKYNVNFERVGDRIFLGGTKRGSSGFGSTGVNVIKKTKLDDWVVKSDDEKVTESNDSPVALKNEKTEEQFETVCEEAKMEVNDKVVVHEKITTD